MNPKVMIIDYKLGNLFSVANACSTVGMSPVISSDPNALQNFDAVILPGVGAFGDALEHLTDLGLVDPIKKYVASGRPLMGVCLGMHLLFTESEEFGSHKGLDIISGTIKKFPTRIEGRKVKVPQIGWNTIQPGVAKKWKGTPLEGLGENEFMYFVHSLYVEPSDPSDILTTTNYDGIEYCSSISKGNIFATQFHPEKSAERGLDIYRKWKESIFE